jgi:hypothetical protein
MQAQTSRALTASRGQRHWRVWLSSLVASRHHPLTIAKPSGLLDVCSGWQDLHSNFPRVARGPGSLLISNGPFPRPMNPIMVQRNTSPRPSPYAPQNAEREKRLPRLGKLAKSDPRRFRGPAQVRFHRTKAGLDDRHPFRMTGKTRRGMMVVADKDSGVCQSAAPERLKAT